MLTTLWEVTATTEEGLSWLPGDRRAAHRMLMAGVQTADLDPGSPREEACMTWWHDPDRRAISVRLRSDLRLGFRDLVATRVQDPAEAALEAEVSVIEIDVARQYTPRVEVDPEVMAFLAARGKTAVRASGSLTPVGPERLPTWSSDKLERVGLQVHRVQVSILDDARLGRVRRERVPVARIRATVSSGGDRSSALASIVHRGVGKAKNYGLGMVRFPDLVSAA